MVVEQLDYTNDDVVVYFNIDANSNYWGPGYITNIQTIGDSHIGNNQIETAEVFIEELGTEITYDQDRNYYMAITINENERPLPENEYHLNVNIDGEVYTSSTVIPGDFVLSNPTPTISDCWQCNGVPVTVEGITIDNSGEQELDDLLYDRYLNDIDNLITELEDNPNVSDVKYYNDDETLQGVECYTESFASVPLFSVKIPDYPSNTSMFKITTIALNDDMEESIQDTSISATLFKGESHYDEDSNTYYRSNPYAFNLSGNEDVCIQDGSSIINMSWLFFNYYGPHIVVISAMDENSGDYFEGDPLGFNPYIAPNSNINNGYGLFSSSNSIFFFVNIVRN